MYSAYATFIRNWIINRRAYPWSFFFSSILTGLLTVAFSYFTFHILADNQIEQTFIQYTGTSDYISYIIVGAAVYLLCVRMLLAISRSLITEQREGTLETLFLTSSSRFHYFIGVTLQSLIAAIGETSAILLIAWPLGLNLRFLQPYTLLMALFVTIIALLGISMILGAIMLMTRDTYIVQNTLVAVMTLVCGFSFPPAYLPVPLQWLGIVIPITGSLRLLRAALLQNTSPTDAISTVIPYTLLGFFYLAIGVYFIHWAEKRALERA